MARVSFRRRIKSGNDNQAKIENENQLKNSQMKIRGREENEGITF